MTNDSMYKFTQDMLTQEASVLAKYIENYNTGVKTVTAKSVTLQQKKQYTCMAQNVVFSERFKCLGMWVFTLPEELLYRAFEMVQGQWLDKVPKNSTASVVA